MMVTRLTQYDLGADYVVTERGRSRFTCVVRHTVFGWYGSAQVNVPPLSRGFTFTGSVRRVSEFRELNLACVVGWDILS